MCLAIPGRITNMPGGEEPLASVEVSGVRRRVNVDLLRDDGLEEDDWVLIHVGFAMSKISEAEAEEQLQLLKVMGEEKAAFEEMQGYDFDDGADGEDTWPFGDKDAPANGKDGQANKDAPANRQTQ